MKTVVATACLLLGAAAHAQPLEFKGVQFGSDSETVRTSLYDSIRNWFCDEPSRFPALADKTCFMGDSTYANQPVKNLTADFYGGRLGSIKMVTRAEDYSEIRAAIVEKYGKPTREVSSEVSNTFGAKFKQTKATWSLRDGVIYLARFNDTVTAGTISISSKEYIDEYARRSAAQPKPKSDI